MTRAAKSHAGRLVTYEQCSGRTGMRLVATHAIELGFDLGLVGGVAHVDHRVPFHRVPLAELQVISDRFLVLEIVLGQRYAAIEDGRHVLVLSQGWLGLQAMALHAKRADFGPQKLWTCAPVRLMANVATLLEGRLVQEVLLGLIRLFRVASQADIDRVRFLESR